MKILTEGPLTKIFRLTPYYKRVLFPTDRKMSNRRTFIFHYTDRTPTTLDSLPVCVNSRRGQIRTQHEVPTVPVSESESVSQKFVKTFQTTKDP